MKCHCNHLILRMYVFLPQLQKAIEGSTCSGVRLRPPLASFRDASRKAKEHPHPPSAPSSPTRDRELWSKEEEKEIKDEPKLDESKETECKVSVDNSSRNSDCSAQGQPTSPSSPSSPSIPLSSLHPLPEQDTSGERDSDDELVWLSFFSSTNLTLCRRSPALAADGQERCNMWCEVFLHFSTSDTDPLSSWQSLSPPVSGRCVSALPQSVSLPACPFICYSEAGAWTSDLISRFNTSISWMIH